MYPVDEVNPHICWQVNREIPEPSAISSILHPERAQRVAGLAELFLERYDIAWKAAVDYVPNYSDDFNAATLGAELGADGPFVPLAYRLNVRTKDGDDILAHDKIGGLPDLRGEVYRWCKWEYLEYKHSKDHRSKKELKRKFPNGEPKIKPISQGLDRIWPKCGCCGRHMQFVGQFNYMDWASAFHILTNRPTTYSSLSAFGSVSNGDTLLDEELHLYFYCPCNQWDNCNNDCTIIRQDNRFDKYDEVLAEIQGKPKSKPKLLYSDAQYKRAVTAFMKRHKVHSDHVDGDWYSPMPMQLVDKYQLGFDVDWLGYGRCEVQEAVNEATGNDGSSYSSSGWEGSDFTLFGGAYSQQDPKRYFNRHGHLGGAKRMSPVLHWTDPHDFSFQLYTDFRWTDRFGPPLQGKIDGSCT
jgi:hypothetical protein